MKASLTARRAARAANPEARRGHTYARRPLGRPAECAVDNSLAARTEHPKPAPLSDFQVPRLKVALERVIPSDPSLLDGAVAEITEAMERAGCWEQTDCIGLALGEALANAIVHGNHCDPAKTVRVYVSVNEECDLLITVGDSGSGFNPDRIANPTAAENVLAHHGRGIFLMRQFMDQVEFKFDHGTEVHMRKRRRWFE